MKKKGIFFSIDTIIAILIAFFVIALLVPFVEHQREKTEVTSDIIKTFSELKIGEIDNAYVKNLIAEGKITNLNNTLLEQIGEFYVTNITLAKELADELLSMLDIDENIGIWYGNDLIASRNSTSLGNSENIEVDRQIISGIKKGESITGFSSRAYLRKNSTTDYFYFGGYVGEGNISARIFYNGTLNKVTLEITSNEDFNVYINGIFSGHYQNSTSDFVPASYDLSAYVSNFHSGENIIKFVGDTQNLHIAGGYIKINYQTQDILEKEKQKYYFPGIEGLINIYDSFYIPGKLNAMDISLHMNSSYIVFLTIGNTTLFNDSTSGEETIVLNDSYLSSMLDYDEISNKTVPLRLGMENATYVINSSMPIDVFSVTDLSGSMCTCSGAGFWCCLFSGGCTYDQANCENCGGTCTGGIYEAKDANKDFIDYILNNSENRVGLVGYADDAPDSDYHALSNDNVSLKNKVDDWTAVGATCICCGINKAVDKLVSDSDSSKSRSVVVMSDGEANVECPAQGTGDPKQDAIQAACDAYNNYRITVNTVGFGSSADETTLRNIANCGNGSYYYGDIDNLTEVYQQIAEDIIQSSYHEQTITTSGGEEVFLYPDSNINFNYTSNSIPYGLAINLEKQFYNDSYGNFSIPENSTVSDAKVISYSGPRWTSLTKINNVVFFNLSKYGSKFIKLGDPYVVNIPLSLISDNNNVELKTGLSPANYSVGSVHNKIIYKIIKQMVSYSPVSSYSNGCTWTIEFEDNTHETMAIPTNYTGSESCSYASSGISYNSDDAMQVAAYNLLKEMDFNSNNKVDVKFTNNDFIISSFEVVGIPYEWSTEVKVVRWY